MTTPLALDMLVCLVDELLVKWLLYNDSGRRRILLTTLEVFDDALRAGRFAMIDDFFGSRYFLNRVNDAPVDWLVTVFMTCKPAREHLPNRALALERFVARVQNTLPDRAEAILKHL